MSVEDPFKKFINLKVSGMLDHLLRIHPLLLMVLGDMAWWCFQRNIKFVLTDLLSSTRRDTKLGRVSASHREGRAADLRSHTFLAAQKEEFIRHFNEKYANIAAISAKTGRPVLIVLHGEGANEHFHIQIHSKFKVK